MDRSSRRATCGYKRESRLLNRTRCYCWEPDWPGCSLRYCAQIVALSRKHQAKQWCGDWRVLFIGRRAPQTFVCDALHTKKKAAKSKELSGQFRVTFITQLR